MVAVNLNEGQKQCEISDAYPAVLRDSPACGPEGTDVDTATEYGAVPFYTTSSLNHQAQAFGGLELEEWDGIVDNDNADADAAGRARARDPKTGSGRETSVGRDRVHVDHRETNINNNVTIRVGGCSLNISGTEGNGDSSNSGSDHDSERGSERP